MQPTPRSPDVDPLVQAEARTAPSGFGGSLHPCRSRRRRISRGARFGRPEGPPNVAFAPSGRSEDHPRFATLHRHDPKAAVRFALASFGAPESALPFAPFQPNRLGRRLALRGLLHPAHPKAHRISLRSASLARRPALLPGSVVGAGRDHPKSLSSPGHRRPTKTSCRNILASFSSFPAPARFPGCPVSPAVFREQPWQICRKARPSCSAHQVYRPTGSLARAGPASTGADVPLRNCAPHPRDRTAFSKIKFLRSPPISRLAAFVLDVMKVSSNGVCANSKMMCLTCG